MNCARQLAQLIEPMNKAEITAFLEDLLTPAELAQLSTRLEVIDLLGKKMPQHKIASRLGIGVATVTRGAKMLKTSKSTNSWGQPPTTSQNI